MPGKTKPTTHNLIIFRDTFIVHVMSRHPPRLHVYFVNCIATDARVIPLFYQPCSLVMDYRNILVQYPSLFLSSLYTQSSRALDTRLCLPYILWIYFLWSIDISILDFLFASCLIFYSFQIWIHHTLLKPRLWDYLFSPFFLFLPISPYIHSLVNGWQPRSTRRWLSWLT